VNGDEVSRFLEVGYQVVEDVISCTNYFTPGTHLMVDSMDLCPCKELNTSHPFCNLLLH